MDPTTFIVGLLSGAAAGALLTGVFDLFNRGWQRAEEKRDLRVGLAAEIRVGLQNVDPEERIHRTPEQNLHFIAGNCFPWEFFKANQNRIGLLPEAAASDVVEYHSLLWQFYEKAKVLNKWTEPDDTGDRDALIAEIRTIMGRIRTVGRPRAQGAVLNVRRQVRATCGARAASAVRAGRAGTRRSRGSPGSRRSR